MDLNRLQPDDEVDYLRDQVAEAQSVFKAARSQILDVVAENQRLTKQLKNAILSHIQDLSLEKEGMTITASNYKVEQDIVELQQQLNQARGDKESIVNLWHLALKEVDKLEQELMDEKLNPEVKVLRALIDKMKEDHRQTLSKLAGRLSSETEEVRQSRDELRANDNKFQQLRQALELSTRQLAEKQYELDQSIQRERLCQEKILELQETIGQLHLRIESSNLEAAELEDASVNLQNGMTMLHNKMGPLKVARLAAVHRAKENIQLAEDALQERDAAVVRERQALRETERLRVALVQMVEEAGAKTTHQTSNMTKSQLEKMSRVNQMLQAKLARRTEECDLRVANADALLEATHAELERANRSKEAALIEIEALKVAAQEAEKRLSEQLDESNRCHQVLTSRQRDLCEQLEALSAQNQSLVREVETAQHRLDEATACLQGQLKEAQKEMTNCRDDWDVQKESLEAKLAVQNEMHALTVNDLSRKITAQLQAHKSWQAETAKTNKTLQTKVARLEAELREWRSQRSADELLGAIGGLGRVDGFGDA